MLGIIVIKSFTVEKDIIIKADPSVVWDALTDPKKTKQYFLSCEAISDWKTGDPILYKMISDGKEVIPVKGFIQEVKEEKFLRYSCFAPEFEDDISKHTYVTFKLEKSKLNTRLLVSQGEFSKEEQYLHSMENWDIVLQGLQSLVEK